MQICAKTILGFEVPAEAMTTSEFKRTCGCSHHHRKPSKDATGPVCGYHKRPWVDMVISDRVGYDPKDSTYKSIYSVVYPFSGDYILPVVIVGVDLGFVYGNLLDNKGVFKTSFDCVQTSLDMVADRYDLETLASDMSVEYDSLRVHTVMFLTSKRL